MKKIICWAALVLALCLPVCALAATEPNTRTIEDTTTYEGETIQITIDQWCYAFNRTSLRFFVANVYVDDPAQLQTAFAGEEYSKSNSEATSAIAERHDAILAVNGDYYNYKDKNGLVIRNGVLYRDEASTRDQLLIMNDGTFVALPRGTCTVAAWVAVLRSGAAFLQLEPDLAADRRDRMVAGGGRTAGRCRAGAALQHSGRPAQFGPEPLRGGGGRASVGAGCADGGQDQPGPHRQP